MTFRVGGHPAKETATWQQGAITFPFTLNASSVGGSEPGGCSQTITADGSTSGQWASDCDSETRAGSYARFYSFTLAQDSEVTLTLESSETDPYLYLRKGTATSGATLHENDDHQGSLSVSRIQATLSAGSYTIEATTYNAGETGSFTFTVSGLGGTNAPLPSPQPHAGDRAALLVFYNATGGSSWANNSGWGTDRPIGEWYGIETNHIGRVVGIHLDENSLTGQIPEELGNLGSLQLLSLKNILISCENGCKTSSPTANRLTGPIPGKLGSPDSLTLLELSYNQLTGEIPVELGNLIRLEVLGLNGNQLGGEIPVELGNLTSLERLGLSANQLSGEIPVELGNLTNLERLGLCCSRLSGEIPVELGNLIRLEVLGLNGNQLGGEIPVELGSLIRLELLGLHGNQLSGEIPVELGNLTRLEILWLNNNQLSGEIPAALGDLDNLELINLARNQFTGACQRACGMYRATTLTCLACPSVDRNGERLTAPPSISRRFLDADQNQSSSLLRRSSTSLGEDDASPCFDFWACRVCG